MISIDENMLYEDISLQLTPHISCKTQTHNKMGIKIPILDGSIPGSLLPLGLSIGHIKIHRIIGLGLIIML